MLERLVLSLISAYLLWELWSGTSRMFLRFHGDDIGAYRGGGLYEFYRNSEDGSGYYWMSWIFKSGMVSLFWIQRGLP